MPETDPRTGRFQQRRRTRAAIVNAAAELAPAGQNHARRRLDRRTEADPAADAPGRVSAMIRAPTGLSSQTMPPSMWPGP